MSQLQQEQDLTVLEPSISSQKKRILVVDDEVDITTIFKLALEKVNLHVDVYNDPLLALSDYKAGMYDLLLFDIRMPGMNGFELYRKIKDIEEERRKLRMVNLGYASSQHMKNFAVNLRKHFQL